MRLIKGKSTRLIARCLPSGLIKFPLIAQVRVITENPLRSIIKRLNGLMIRIAKNSESCSIESEKLMKIDTKNVLENFRFVDKVAVGISFNRKVFPRRMLRYRYQIINCQAAPKTESYTQIN